MELDKIYNVDIMEGLGMMEDCTVDLVVTSPPYNVGIKYDSWNDEMEESAYFDWVSRWCKELYRVLKPDGRFAINVPYEVAKPRRMFFSAEINKSIIGAGFNFNGFVDLVENHPQRNVFARGSFLSPSSPYIFNPKECVLLYYKETKKKSEKKESYFDTSDEKKKEFLEYTSGFWDYRPQTKVITQANFSLDIPEKAIKILSWKGDTILDPFMGSGTTAVASIKLERHYIGFELSKSYYEVSEKVISDLRT